MERTAPAVARAARSLARPPSWSPSTGQHAARSSLDILHLLAHLIDHRLQSKSGARDLHVVGLGAERIGLAIKFLGEEVELAADGPVLAEQLASRADMGAQPLQLLLDVGAGSNEHGLLMQAHWIEP